MADPSFNNTSPMGDDSFEAADAVPVVTDDLDDENTGRAPIDLDAPIDAAEPAPTPPAPATPPAASRKDTDELKAQLAQANDDKLRALADLQNFRRRGEEERLRIIRDGNERLIKELLPVLDDFDLALMAANQAQSFEQLIGGVEATRRKFHETLAKQGVTPIEAVGQPFDPDLHEAVMLDEDTGQPDETVTAELRRGYTLHQRVIRPSLVKVAKGG